MRGGAAAALRRPQAGPARHEGALAVTLVREGASRQNHEVQAGHRGRPLERPGEPPLRELTRLVRGGFCQLLGLGPGVWRVCLGVGLRLAS